MGVAGDWGTLQETVSTVDTRRLRCEEGERARNKARSKITEI